MSFKKSINVFRKKATRSITKKLLDQKGLKLNDKSKIKRILITRPNHRLGNQLLITPLVKEVHDCFPNATIDLFLKGNLGPVIYKNYTYVDRIICLPKQHFKKLHQYLYSWLKLKKYYYDLVINAEASSSSGRLSTKVARSQHKFFGFERELNLFKTSDAVHISKYPVYSLRYFLNQNISEKPLPDLEIKLSKKELNLGKELLSKFVDLSKPTLCLYTFATGKKCFSKKWWTNFYDALQKSFPNFNIIEVLPVENVSSLDFKIPAFYSQNIRELAAFISQTSVFITGDCGIMHLASASNTPTIGLFNITDKAMYEPYNKSCLGIDTNVKSEFEVAQLLKNNINNLKLAEN